jgi:hypothetical protein
MLEHREHGPAVVIVGIALLAALGGGTAPGALRWQASAVPGLLTAQLPLGGIDEPYLQAPEGLCRIVPLSGAGGARLEEVRAAYPRMSLAAAQSGKAGQLPEFVLLCPALSAAAQR